MLKYCARMQSELREDESNFTLFSANQRSCLIAAEAAAAAAVAYVGYFYDVICKLQCCGVKPFGEEKLARSSTRTSKW